MKKVFTSKTTYIAIVAFLLGLLIMSFFFPERIAKLKNGEEELVTYKGGRITADELFIDLKKYSNIEILLSKIDKTILNSIYEITEEMNNEIKNNADEYIAYYEENGYSKEEFLSQSGFTSYEDFTDFLTVEYLQNKYYEDSIKDSISDKDIEKYYKDNVFGDISTKFIAVDLTDEKAEDTIAKILKDLKNGSTYDSIVKKYKDSITNDNLNYVSFDSNLDESYLSNLKTLKDGKYTTNYVETEYGYTIIFRDKSNEKLDLQTVKDRIVDALVSETIANDESQTGLQKALMELRKKYNIEFKDTEYKKKYDDYIKTINN